MTPKLKHIALFVMILAHIAACQGEQVVTTTPTETAAVKLLKTGLIWTKDANAPGPAACTPETTKNWQASHDYVKCLNMNSYLGFTDWRPPNRNELSSLINYAQLNQATWLVGLGFTGVQSVYYWSSSSSADSTSDAWGIDMGDGDLDGDDKSYSQYVWPVRSGQ